MDPLEIYSGTMEHILHRLQKDLANLREALTVDSLTPSALDNLESAEVVARQALCLHVTWANLQEKRIEEEIAVVELQPKAPSPETEEYDKWVADESFRLASDASAVANITAQMSIGVRRARMFHS